MSETISNIPYGEIESGAEKWSDPTEIIDTLENGSVQKLGDVRTHFPEIIDEHSNVVELATLKNAIDDHSSSAEPVAVRFDGKEVLAVYKPVSGENKEISSEFGHKMYPREKAAFAVSEHFGFKFVPPTISREVEGVMGSLQLFLPPPNFVPGKKAFEAYSNEDLDALKNSKIIRELQVFDFIIANPERHLNNFLVEFSSDGTPKYDYDGEPGLVAIDHGVSMDQDYYLYHGAFEVNYGPYIFLTHENVTGESLETEIPEWLLEKIESGLDKSGDLNGILSGIDGLESTEIDQLWERVSLLREKKVFISSDNYRSVIKRS